MVVTAALIVQDGKILIARRGSGRHLAGFWEFPGGKLEEGETPEACLAREIREELGIDIEVGELYASNTHRYESKTVELLAYEARPHSADYRLTAHSEIRWIDPALLLDEDLAPADIPIAEKLAADGIHLRAETARR